MNESDAGDPPGGGIWRRRGVLGAIGTLAAAGGAAPGQESRPLGEAATPVAPVDAGSLAFQRAGRGAVRRSVAARLDDLPLSPEDFGAIGDGRADDSDAFVATIAEAVRRHNATIWLGGGRNYKITRTLNIPQGIALVGPGSQGSTSGFGCSIQHHADGDLFVWNGAGQTYAGTGGGLRNVLIVKSADFVGGTAISLIATGDDHRPGEMLFENVLVYGGSSEGRQGLWDHGLLIDGRVADTAGRRGVRSTRWIGCRFAGIRVAGQTILLRQVTHAFFFGCAIDQAGNTPGGITLEGTNDDVHFSAFGLGGDLLIGLHGSGTVLNFHFSGKIGGRFVNEDAAATGTLAASFSPTGRYVLLNRATGLRTLTNIDPGFRVVQQRGASIAAAPQPTAISWDTEVFDRGNNMLVVTDRYNCMNAGLHRFAATLAFLPLRSGRIILSFVCMRVDGRRERVSTAIQVGAGTESTVSHMAMFVLDFGDAVSVAIAADRGAAGPVRLLPWDDSTGIGCVFEGGLSS